MATPYERDDRGRPLRYTGEQEDGDVSGLYYLRARYYDPALGRFWTQDPWGGSAASPQTLNKYPYVGSNPANLVDPYGLCGFLDPVDCVQDAAECVANAGDCVREPIADAAEATHDFLSESGAELAAELNELALALDLGAATYVDTVAALGCTLAPPACPAIYAAAVASASPVIIGSNLVSLGASAAYCYDRLTDDKEGGRWTGGNIKDCAVSGAYSVGGLAVADPNISALLNGYTVCRDRGRCSFP